MAASLLARFTVSKLTMEDVARAAGIARQTIYKHFSGKDDLLTELFVQQMELNQYPALRKLNDRPSPEALLRLFMTELGLARSYALFNEVLDPGRGPPDGRTRLQLREDDRPPGNRSGCRSSSSTKPSASCGPASTTAPLSGGSPTRSSGSSRTPASCATTTSSSRIHAGVRHRRPRPGARQPDPPRRQTRKARAYGALLLSERPLGQGIAAGSLEPRRHYVGGRRPRRSAECSREARWLRRVRITAAGPGYITIIG